LKWLWESSSTKEDKLNPIAILAGCHLTQSDAGTFKGSIFSMGGMNMNNWQTNIENVHHIFWW
jgi:hypothetical protein